MISNQDSEYKSFYSILQQTSVEVNQKANALSCNFEIGQDLGLKYWIEPFDAFNLDDDRILDYQIQSIFTNDLILVDDRKQGLPHVFQASATEFDTKRGLIRAFQETRTKLSVHLNRAADNFLSKIS